MFVSFSCVSFVNLTQSFAEDLLPPSGSGGGEQPSSVANFLQKLRRSDLQQVSRAGTRRRLSLNSSC